MAVINTDCCDYLQLDFVDREKAKYDGNLHSSFLSCRVTLNVLYDSSPTGRAGLRPEQQLLDDAVNVENIMYTIATISLDLHQSQGVRILEVRYEQPRYSWRAMCWSGPVQTEDENRQILI